MKMKHYVSVAVLALAFAACSDDYDDSALWDAVNGNTQRIEALEAWQDEVNGNIAALQQLLNTTDYITSVTPLTENGEEVGYVIEFHNSDPITIRHGAKGDKGDKGDKGEQGEQGPQGEPGKDGEDGADGSDGEDGSTPVIGLTQRKDGNWYWTLNGELMTDPEGNPVRANGEDGDAGTSAPTPQILLGANLPSDGKVMTDSGKAQADAWYLSVNDGAEWYRISGDKGADGNDGSAGADGDDGVLKVETSTDGNSVTLTFDDGSILTLPTWKWAQGIEKKIEDLNSQLEAYGNLMEGKSFITSVTAVEGGQQITYVTVDENGTETSHSFTITNGKDGDDGATPTVKIGNNGNWIINGTDTGVSAKGQNGTDGKTPTFKIENGNLYYQFEGDDDWKDLGNVTGPKGDKGDTGEQGPEGEDGEDGKNGDSFFKDAVYNEGDAFATFTLAGGTVFKVPIYQGTIKIGEGTGTLTLEDTETTVYITLPTGTEADDYTALVAQITPEGTDGTYTDIDSRATGVRGWSVTADLETKTVKITSSGGNALLRVTLIRTDGSELTASRVVHSQKYIVYTAEGLLAWAEAARKDLSTSCTLAANLDLTDTEWTPIGDYDNPYTGTFDGAGHTLTGLTINQSEANYIGLFGAIGEGGTVKNLKLTSVAIKGYNWVGAVAGSNSGIIENCSAAGKITGSSEGVGGIAGVNDGIITNCSAASSVTGSMYVGGITGYQFNGTTTGCSATAEITGSGEWVGGIIGYQIDGTTADCHSSATVKGRYKVGGVIGQIETENKKSRSHCLFVYGRRNQYI
ncbi:Collagen triple helix repeat-containing protein [Phocaeicola salanitronis DSM 18170]|uniref:Collagen triple helix repeat-containing protein n=1 Tax=Phocaeicola salanitronis (strain DSM 18170 / JCM 13657 / CCUG 60908 / BL78) TaxID=667015 RepID=F0R754_PHOSB|nr:collagen-like triple helix repeat-containing protein [Phocaeicola salanitronis]ADY35861.1 Collagen triple helix repeat-containing protein [Phocaeicola salanitronis DSM 18170]